MNKKRIFGLAIIVTGLLLVITTGAVFARNNLHGMPPFWADDETNEGTQYPYGHMRGYGSHMGYTEDYPPMMSLMVEAVSEKTDLTVEDIESRLGDGEHLFEIALSAGITEEDYLQLMTDVRESYLSDALENGWITEEQSEWMEDHMLGDEMPYGNEASPCHGFQNRESNYPDQFHHGMGWH